MTLASSWRLALRGSGNILQSALFDSIELIVQLDRQVFVSQVRTASSLNSQLTLGVTLKLLRFDHRPSTILIAMSSTFDPQDLDDLLGPDNVETEDLVLSHL
jgi:hypothetical protein